MKLIPRKLNAPKTALTAAPKAAAASAQKAPVAGPEATIGAVSWHSAPQAHGATSAIYSAPVPPTVTLVPPASMTKNVKTSTIVAPDQGSPEWPLTPYLVANLHSGLIDHKEQHLTAHEAVSVTHAVAFDAYVILGMSNKSTAVPANPVKGNSMLTHTARAYASLVEIDTHAFHLSSMPTSSLDEQASIRVNTQASATHTPALLASTGKAKTAVTASASTFAPVANFPSAMDTKGSDSLGIELSGIAAALLLLAVVAVPVLAVVTRTVKKDADQDECEMLNRQAAGGAALV